MNISRISSDPVLVVSGLAKSFLVRGKPVPIFTDVSFSVGPSEILGIVGPSGIGKTTLLNIIAGELHYDCGQIRWKNDSGNQSLTRSAMIFQDDTVFPWMRVAENVAFAKTIRPGKRNASVMREAKTFLNELGLGEYADYWPRELSGGMRKRVELARAVYSRPQIMLLDEPFSMLDTITKAGVHEWFINHLKGRDLAAILVTHEIREAIELSDRVIVLNGKPGTVRIELTGLRSNPAAGPPEFDRLELEIIDAMNS